MRDVAILEPATISQRENVPSGRHLPPATLRWEDVGRELAVDRWVSASPSANTRTAYRGDIRRWFAWCDLYGIRLEDARRWDIDAYRDEMADDEEPPKVATVRRRLAAVSSFYTYWVREDVLPRNPAVHAARPRALKEPTSVALTRAQARQLLDYVDQLPDIRPALVVRLLLETGMRVSELCGATVADLGYTGGHRTLTITRKGGLRATLPLTPGLAHGFDVYLQGRTVGPLLATSGCKNDGVPGPLERKYVRGLLRRLVVEAGLPSEVCERMHPHVLRHTVATLLDEAGLTIQEIQRLLGHADPRTTEIYVEHRRGLDSSPVYVLGRMLATAEPCPQ
jgi:site-specific recombinase XerD